jgi:RNA polymerase sigma-70 factor (ECF subfamily)
LRRESGDAALALVAAATPAERDDPEPLAAALADLSPEHRAVIVMRHVLDYTPGEIAEALGLPRGTVNSRLRRGLDELAGKLDEDLK